MIARLSRCERAIRAVHELSRISTRHVEKTDAIPPLCAFVPLTFHFSAATPMPPHRHDKCNQPSRSRMHYSLPHGSLMKRTAAFTLVELLVVIAIIGVLVS